MKYHMLVVLVVVVCFVTQLVSAQELTRAVTAGGSGATSNPPSATAPSAISAEVDLDHEPRSGAGTMVVVVGAGGTDEFASQFAEWAQVWSLAAEKQKLMLLQIGGAESAGGTSGETDDRELLRRAIESHRQASPLWIVLIGHGTYDRNVAKFNLRGPDFTAEELATWTTAVAGPLLVVNCSSCSGPFLAAIKGNNRVVITATNSGAELNYARFGGYLAKAWTAKNADLDHDQQVSLLEAFLFASASVAKFYEAESRLATEHALLEDNGDGLGTSADFFVGIRAEGKGKDGAIPDGRLAHQFILVPGPDAPRLTPEQIVRRDQLEDAVERLRDRKRNLPEDDYYQQLETILVELAQLSNSN